MSSEIDILPEGWQKTTLEHLIIRISNGVNITQYEEKIGLPITRIETIWNGTIDLNRVRYIKEDSDELRSKYGLRHGDILFSHINSDSHLGKTALFRSQAKCLIHGINLLLIRPSAEISSEYLNYQIRFLRQKGEFVAAAQRAVNQSSINQRKLKSFEFLLPPLNEQHRIVAKVEELFSELDKGVESLKTAQAQLKVYRQAVLKHAFEGKLTAQWREMHSATPWTQTTLGSQLSFLTSGSRGWAKFYAEHGDKFIRAQNLKHDRLDLADMAFVDLPDKSEGMRTRVQIGDLLITITGANVTKTAFVTSDIGTAYVSQHVALARPVEGSNTEFLYWYLVSESAGRKQLTASAYGAGKPGLNLENIRSVKIPLPSAEEQTEIVSRINTILSSERNISAQIDIQLARSEALRQSILKKAFSGQLVPQDPHDESASVLLDRIRAEREKVVQNNHSGKTKRRRTTT